MKTDPKNDRKNTVVRLADAREQSDTISSSRQVENLPYHELPTKMVVAIDGWAQSGKNTAGELVAEAIGGVLVDSGRFYRALTKTFLDAGVDLNDSEAVTRFCRKMSLEVHLGREGDKADEVLVSVCGHFFNKEELKQVGAETSKVARVREVRDLVNNMLKLCQMYGRVVMLGRDIGGVVFPKTPFKFFLDAPERIREQRHFQSTQTQGAVRRDREDQKHVVFADDALMIDTGKLEPAEVRWLILVELFWRAAKKNALPRTV